MRFIGVLFGRPFDNWFPHTKTAMPFEKQYSNGCPQLPRVVLTSGLWRTFGKWPIRPELLDSAVEYVHIHIGLGSRNVHLQ